jgi:hypothetical protein
VSVGKWQVRGPILLITALTLAVLTVVIVTGASSAQTKQQTYDACQPGADAITASRLPETVSLQRCPVGERVIRDNGVGTVLPAPGQGVLVDALTLTGSQELAVTRYRDGTVELNHVGDESQSEPEIDTASSPGECSDGAKSDLRYAVKKPQAGGIHWFFNPRTTPDELTRKGALRAIRKGTANIMNAKNNCHLGKVIPREVIFAYDGSTRDRAQVGPRGGCTGNDRKTVVSFGRLPESALAVTCTAWSVEPGYDRVHWSDIMINKTNFNWTIRPEARSCKGKYDLASTVTHERGHTFGLGHVSESQHRNLTMSDRSNGPCQRSEQSLGRGDWRGLVCKYRHKRYC